MNWPLWLGALPPLADRENDTLLPSEDDEARRLTGQVWR